MFSYFAHTKSIRNSETTLPTNSQGQVNKVFLLISILFICSTSNYGQAIASLQSNMEHNTYIDLNAFFEPVLSNNFYGINLECKGYPFKKIATGFSFSFAPKYIDNNFPYSIGKPLIAYFEFGWINQYDFLQSDKIRIGFSLNNGMTISRLGDDDIKIERRSGDRGTISFISKEVATNYFYLLQPGLSMSFRINNSPNFVLYLTAKAKYNFVFGKCKYGQLSDFSNPYLAFGFSFFFPRDPEE